MLAQCGMYAKSVNASMVEAQESMLKAILRNGSKAVKQSPMETLLESDAMFGLALEVNG